METSDDVGRFVTFNFTHKLHRLLNYPLRPNILNKKMGIRISDQSQKMEMGETGGETHVGIPAKDLLARFLKELPPL